MSNSQTMIKKDALIKIEVSTGYLQKLHEMLVGILSERTAEEIDSFKTYSDAGSEFPESWMEHVVTVSSLIQAIEAAAIDQGHTYEKEINTTEN